MKGGGGGEGKVEHFLCAAPPPPSTEKAARKEGGRGRKKAEKQHSALQRRVCVGRGVGELGSGLPRALRKKTPALLNGPIPAQQ